ncbi:histidine phosphatase family protein [Clavibacter tessellarius]|uniref:histidine phosphatase family protein n=1 Tax=Clavibacter tessellarius TaxID=31965 RepID=UPI003244E76B
MGYGDQAEVDDRLVEFDYGAYEGRTTADIQSERGHWDLWTDGVPAGDTPGETSQQVRDRVLQVLERVLPVLESGQDVLLVAHAHVIRALAVAWVGLPAEAGGILTLSTSTLSESRLRARPPRDHALELPGGRLGAVARGRQPLADAACGRPLPAARSPAHGLRTARKRPRAADA